jgi:hypothetical protein
MRDTRSDFSRRDLLALSGLAAGALAAAKAEAAASAPTAPVSVAKVRGYDEDLTAQFEKMFDQIGGIGKLVQGKTVAMKLNLTGGGRFEGIRESSAH